MPDPDPLPELPEDARIDIEDEARLRYWAERLGTDPGRLRAAVAAVGPELRRLREALAGVPAVAPQDAAAAVEAAVLPTDADRDVSGNAGLPHYDIHKEAS